MSLILDGIILLIVIVCALLAAKKGFVRTLIELVGFVLAIIVAFMVANPVAGFIYDSAVKPVAESAIQTVVEKGGTTAFEALPEFIKNIAEKANLTPDSIIQASGTSAQEIAINIQVLLFFLLPEPHFPVYTPPQSIHTCFFR